MTGRLFRRFQVACAVARVLVMWPVIAVAGGLGRHTDEGRRTGRRWVPSAPLGIIVGSRPRYSGFPRLTHWRINEYGWRARLKLRSGDTPEAVAKVVPGMRHGFRAAVVSVRPLRPGWCELVVLRRDPLAVAAPWAPVALSPTSALVGVRDDGEPFVMDFRLMPHWLTCGATNAGKSSITSALFAALAPTDVALLGVDCKHGVEQSLMRGRMTEVAVMPAEALRVMERLHRVIKQRADVCLDHHVRNVFDLPEDAPERRPIVLLIDEVAELLLITGDDKELPKRLGVALLRLVQLGRAFAVYVVLAGQRFGSDLGGPVTAIRAQCAGRVVMRVSDVETARMTLGDLAADAVEASQLIPPELPGVAVAAGGPFGWQRVRTIYVDAARVEAIAVEHAARTPSWADLEDAVSRRAVGVAA